MKNMKKSSSLHVRAITLISIALALIVMAQPVFCYNKAALDYFKANKKLRGSNPEDVDLSYANLAGLDLSKSQLCGVDLSSANLSGANLSKAALSDADLSGADLSGANLSNVILTRAKVGANFAGANLSNAKLSHCTIEKQKHIYNINLSHANLTYADLSEALLICGNMSFAIFNMANLYRAALEQSDCFGASFAGAEMACVLIGYSDLRNTNFTNANLSRANLMFLFKKHDCVQTPFSAEDYRTIDFTGAELSGAFIPTP